MAVTKKQQTVVLGVGCDSDEEIDMVYWLQEALELGLIENVRHKPYTIIVNDSVPHPGTFIKMDGRRKEPTFTVESSKVRVIAEHKYTPDLSANLTDIGMMILAKQVALNEGRQWVVDVKGKRSGGKNNTSGTTFPLKQAMTYDRYGVIVQKIVPITFFRHAWLPYECKFTKKKRDLRVCFHREGEKPYPEIDSIHKRLEVFYKAGWIDRKTKKATPELIRLWPGIKGVEYGSKNRPDAGSEEDIQESFF